MEPLRRMAAVYQTEIASLKDILKTVKRLQDDFFTEIKRVSDEVGIQMQEPAEIDLMDADTQTFQRIIEGVQEKASPETLTLLKDAGNVTNKLPEVISENYSSIQNPPLQKETDYLRDGYFKTLALIPLAQDKGITHGQRMLLSGLLTGIGENFRSEILAQAQKMELKEYAEYLDNLKAIPLRYRFALDAVLLACCGSQNEDALKVAASMLDSLRIDRATAEYLCALAKSILVQDSDALGEARHMMKDVSCQESLFDGYIRPFIKDFVHISDTRIEIRFLERKSIETLPFNVWQNMKNLTISKIVNDYFSYALKALFERESDSKAPRTAVFENVFFPGNGWTFNRYDNITFKNCVFHKDNPNPVRKFQKKQFPKWGEWESCLLFMNVKHIQFEECRFYNCNGVAVGEALVQSASFEGCRFENCWLLYSGNPSNVSLLGALICNCGTNGTNIISHSEFVNCGAICSQRSDATAILSNCKCVVRENRFVNCRQRIELGKEHGLGEVAIIFGMLNKLNETLFLPNTADEGNTLIDSVKIS